MQGEHVKCNFANPKKGYVSY